MQKKKKKESYFCKQVIRRLYPYGNWCTQKIVGNCAPVTEEEPDDTSDTVHIPVTVTITEGNREMDTW